MPKEKPIYRVVQKGRAVCGYARIVVYTPTLASVEIDMATKWCDTIAATSDDKGNVGLIITDTSRSICVNEESLSNTEIEFPRFKGWDIFCYSCNRYALRVVFNKVVF